MQRFLRKDQENLSNSNVKTGFGWPTPSAFESMGKGMLDVLTSAPKGAAEGGKVVLGGVTGVFNNIGSLGQKKPSSSSIGTHTAGRSSTSVLPRMDSMNSLSSSQKSRASEDSVRTAPVIQTQSLKAAPMERRPSHHSLVEDEGEQHPSSERTSLSGPRSTTHSREASRGPSRRGTPLSSPTLNRSVDDIRLPPPPSTIPDNYGFVDDQFDVQARTETTLPISRTSMSTAPYQSPPPPQINRNNSVPVSKQSAVPALISHRKLKKPSAPFSEQETKVAVELLFAVINELYTLSSAWNIRRTLLTAAKTFLLRPGNPSLSSIQSLIQDSVIASNTSDSGIASHLRKIRTNSLPTEEELKTWPAEMSPEEKERLRIKARKMIVERGVPAALTGVMGQAATGEAVGRVFDCLQVEEVARGLIFGLLLQGVRAVTH